MKSTDIKTTTYFVGQRSDQLFGLQAQHVRESSTYETLTALPGTRPELVGVVNRRNTVLPIILPDRWLLTEQIAYDSSKPVVVVSYQNVTFGLQLDSILGVHTAEEAQHHPHPYKAETDYFTHLVTLDGGTMFTAIDAKLLIKEISTLTL